MARMVVTQRTEVNPTGIIIHMDLLAIALVIGITFGAIWALVPIVLGMLIVAITAPS